MALRDRAKVAAEIVLLRAGAAHLSRRLRSGQTLVLAYHNIVPAREQPGGDRSLHLPVTRFAAQLDLLARHHDVVPLDQALTPHSGPRPRAVVTFDDAYAGTLHAGIPELVRRGLPATIFVCPAFLGGRTFWWDALTRPDHPAPATALRRHALGPLAGQDDRIRPWAAKHGFPEYPVPDHARCATEADLRDALSHPGITLGSHTWSHANLAELDGTALDEELTKPRAWLAEHLGANADWLAYPYGYHNPRAEDAARRAGYRGALALHAGWVRPTAPNPFALPRLNVPAGVSANGFALRIAGLIAR